MGDTVFEIPRLRTMARHALPSVLEGTVIPLLVFLTFLHLVGVLGAMIAGLLWAYSAFLRRLWRRERVPGLLVLSVVGITAKTVVAVATGSVILYFIQPTVGTVLVAAAFLASVPLGKPLAEKLARDFFPMDPTTLANRHVRRFFSQISVLWSVSNLVNATLTLWLLLDHSLTTYLVFRTTLSPLLTGSVVALSFLWFRISMARGGIPVHVAQGGRSGVVIQRLLAGRR